MPRVRVCDDVQNFPQLAGPLGLHQGWPAGWTVGGWLGSSLPASCWSITLCAPAWAPSLQGCYPHTERGVFCAWLHLGCIERGYARARNYSSPGPWLMEAVLKWMFFLFG